MRRAPILSSMGLPEGESEVIRDLSQNLNSLGQYVRSLESAVALFGLAENIVRRDHTQEIVHEWCFIAARDGAMTIYNFGKVWQVIPGQVKRSPTIEPTISKAGLKAVGRAFETGFPDWAAVRKGAAHRGDFGKDAENIAEHRVRGPFLLTGLSAGDVDVYINNNLHGRSYTSTVEGKVVSYEVTRETVERLDEIKNMAWDVFEHLDFMKMSGPKGSR